MDVPQISQISQISRILQTRLPYGCAPRQFQIEAVEFSRASRYRCLIADQMGLGKSIEALCTIAADPKRLLPAVVVCPASMLYTWEAEILKWLPTVKVHVLARGRTPFPRAGFLGIVVTTWNLLGSHAQNLVKRGFKLVIADEVHYSSHQEAQRSQAFAYLALRVPHVIALSGTPLKNNTKELWHLLHILEPRRWPDYDSFVEQYGKATDAPKLKAVLSRYMIRRLKADVLQELPDKQRVFVPLELPDSIRAEYDEAEADFKKWLHHQQSLGAGVTQNAALAKAGQLRKLVGMAKVRAAVDQILTFKRQREPVLAFCEHLDVLQALQEGLDGKARVGVIQGETPKTTRRGVIEAFQSGKLDVMLGTQAAKEGITLTRASNVLFVERWWTPADEEQGEDRCHRLGQKNAVTVWYLHAVHTIDDRIRKLVEKKRKISQAAIGDTVISEQEADVVTDFLASFLDDDTEDDSEFLEEKGTSRGKDAGSPGLPDHRLVHALLFHRSLWTPAAAKHWTRMHSFPTRKLEQLPQYQRVVCQPSERFHTGSFKAKRLNETVTAILGTPRR